MVPNWRRGTSLPGAWKGRLPYVTFNLASPCRTATLRASTAGFGMNVSMRTGSAIYSTYATTPLSGGTIITARAHIAAWPTGRRASLQLNGNALRPRSIPCRSGTIRQGYPDGALTRGLAGRTRCSEPPDMRTKGSSDRVLRDNFRSLAGPAKRDRSGHRRGVNICPYTRAGSTHKFSWDGALKGSCVSF